MLVGFGGLTTDTKDPGAPFPERVGTRTAANGSYTLTAPAGRYGDLVFQAGGGYDAVTVPDFTVSAGATRAQNAALRRDWSASKGGAEVLIDDSKYDDTGAPFGCGLAQLIDQSLGAGMLAVQPGQRRSGEPARRPADRDDQAAAAGRHHHVRLDPSNTCGDDPSATTKDYRIETSTDGATSRSPSRAASRWTTARG